MKNAESPVPLCASFELETRTRWMVRLNGANRAAQEACKQVQAILASNACVYAFVGSLAPALKRIYVITRTLKTYTRGHQMSTGIPAFLPVMSQFDCVVASLPRHVTAQSRIYAKLRNYPSAVAFVCCR
jgi:hypothetical protein